MSTDEIVSRTRLLDNEIKIMKSDVMRISHELQAQNEKIKENTEKIKVNKTLPYLVSNVIEVSFDDWARGSKIEYIQINPGPLFVLNHKKNSCFNSF